MYNRLMRYNWQLDDWPKFQCDSSLFVESQVDFFRKMGRVEGFLEGLSGEDRLDSTIELMVAEAVKTSEIEGEMISRKDVMSSIKNNLRLNPENEHVRDARAVGAAELMLDVRSGYDKDLTVEDLFSWHRMLMKGNRYIDPGRWRTHPEPMQVVSGVLGKETVHFEAPPSSRVPSEMKQFVHWFNDTGPAGAHEIKNPLVRSAVAHLYFESIHPFEDGNGRVGRAVSEKALSQSIGQAVLLSLSRTIEADKNAYYEALKAGQQSNEITSWIVYFSEVVLAAQIQAEESIQFTLHKTRFFQRYESELSERQLRVIRRMLEEGPAGFQGGMSARKYVRITHTSKATATRDLQDLANQGIFTPIGGGRNIHYEINLG